MNRILIALLALLGLATQVAPVEARACGIGSAAVRSLGGECHQAPVHAAQFIAFTAQAPQSASLAWQAAAPIAWALPTAVAAVRIGIDRSRQ